jgi:hypothetical protein
MAAGGAAAASTDGNPEEAAAGATGLLRVRLWTAARQAVLRDRTLDQRIRRTRQVYEQILSGRCPGCGSALPPTTRPGDAPRRRHERR